MINRITDTPPPATLFKYRDWNNENHRRLISHYEIFLPKPSDFNDPFDGNIPVRWDLMSYKDCYDKNLNLVSVMNPNMDKKSWGLIAKKVTDDKSAWHPEKMKIENEKQLSKWDSEIGLLSLTSISNNILMWSHYSHHHTGFVVGLDTVSLMSKHDFGYLEPIIYTSGYPIINGKDDLTQQFHKKFFHKSELWKYEKEWRVSKNHIENRIIKLYPETINQIIIGCCTESKDVKSIINTSRKYLGSKIPIYKAKKSEYNFELEIIQIE